MPFLSSPPTPLHAHAMADIQLKLMELVVPGILPGINRDVPSSKFSNKLLFKRLFLNDLMSVFTPIPVATVKSITIYIHYFTEKSFILCQTFAYCYPTHKCISQKGFVFIYKRTVCRNPHEDTL